MELIERYVREVERHLPDHMTKDVGDELRSSLLDAVDMDSGNDRDAVLRERLLEMGPPELLARSYLGQEPALVGAALYTAWRRTVGWVLSVVIALNVLMRALSSDLLKLETLGALATSGLIAFALVTLIFAATERVFRAEPPAESEWTPEDLPRRTALDDINHPGGYTGLVLAVLGLVILNVYPGWSGLVGSGTADWGLPKLLAADFGTTYLPWINIWLAGVLAVSVLGLHFRRRPVWLGWLRIATLAPALVIAGLIFAGQPLFELTVTRGIFQESVWLRETLLVWIERLLHFGVIMDVAIVAYHRVREAAVLVRRGRG